MQSASTTPAEYLASLPADRQAVINGLRAAIKKHLPKGFEERMAYGMLGYVVPHKLYPPGYHCSPDKPLPFINLASQKRHVALYHMGLYAGPLADWFAAEWPKHTEARLDLGKCCVRMTKLDQVPYELIGQLAGKLTPQQWIDSYESAVKGARSVPAKPTAKKTTAKKTTAKKTAAKKTTAKKTAAKKTAAKKTAAKKTAAKKTATTGARPGQA